MAHYYKNQPPHNPPQTNMASPGDDTPQPHLLSEFDKLRETLLTDDAEEGWASELRQYLGSMQRDVMKDTDLVQWCQVRYSLV